MNDDSPRPYGVPAQRTPVEFDADTGHLRIGSHARPVPDAGESSQVYRAYLSLLYAVRGAQPSEQLSLRSADIEALLLIVGDDPETIEQRLIGLMGCTADEAAAVSRVLLRHRKLTATLGIAAGLSLGVVAAASGTLDSPPAQTTHVQSAGAASPSDLRTTGASKAGADAASPVQATTSVVLAAAEAPTSGTAFTSHLGSALRSGTVDGPTTRPDRPVSAPAEAEPTAGDRPTTTPADAAPTPVQPSPGTGQTGPRQPDTPNDTPGVPPVLPGQPIWGTTPLDPDDSVTDPVIVPVDLPLPTGAAPPPSVPASAPGSGEGGPSDTAPIDQAPTDRAPAAPTPTD